MKRRIVIVLTILTFLWAIIYHNTSINLFPQENRVEILYPGDKGKLHNAWNLVAESAIGFFLEQPIWEADRLVINDGNIFTTQMIETGLMQAGLDLSEFKVIDYSWTSDVLNQTKVLWFSASEILLILMMLNIMWKQFLSETAQLRKALSTQYMWDYLHNSGARLLVKAIVGVEMIIISILLIRRIINVPIELPSTLLPTDSLFDWYHYQEWVVHHFPVSQISEYGQTLARLLQKCLALNVVEVGCLIVFATSLRKKHIYGRKKNYDQSV